MVFVWFESEDISYFKLSNKIAFKICTNKFKNKFNQNNINQTIFKKILNKLVLHDHPEESSENTCDFGEIRKYVYPFAMAVYEKTKFEAQKKKEDKYHKNNIGQLYFI